VELASLGWDKIFAGAFAEHAQVGLIPARVALEHKHAYILWSESGELTGRLLGRLLKAGDRSRLPTVGDWVAIKPRATEKRASIHAVLPRRTRFSRRAAGERDEEQVIASNIDTVFLVNGLDADFNPRRIERYLALARNSGAEMVVLLNKADLDVDVAGSTETVRAIAGDVPVLAISATTGSGVETLQPYLRFGRTAALLGSSGAGKSTLVNRLLGTSRQSVGTLRHDDDRGRHTTTRRELIVLPGGALLIDTPGMRELQLWDSARDGLVAVFPEIVALAAQCRFRDCRHNAEPECAVQAAIRSQHLGPGRFASFLKLRAELEARSSPGAKTGRRLGPRVTGRRIMRG